MGDVPSSETKPSSWSWRFVLSCVFILPIVSFSWLAVLRAPTTKLWMLSILMTEAGYVFAVVLLVGCFLVDRSRASGKWLSVLGILGIGMVLSPWARAVAMLPAMKNELINTLGTDEPLLKDGVTGQTAPLLLGRLLGTSDPGVKRKSYTLKVPGKKLLVDVYQQSSVQKPQPLLVSIHGGAWRTGSPRFLTRMNPYFAARGITVAAISYRLMPKYKFPTQSNDVTHTLKWLRSQAKTLRIDPNRIALMGRSAGGHLSLLAGYKQVVPGIRGVVNFYGPTDLHWSWANPANPWVINSTKVLKGFLGGSPKQVKQAYDQASPIRFASAKSPPTLLIQGTRDELVSPVHNRRLAARLKTLGVQHYLLELPWATHGCDAILFGPCGQLSLYAMERFFRVTLLKP